MRGVEVICGLVETAKLEENRTQRKRKHNKVGSAVDQPVNRRWCAFVVLPVTMEPSVTMNRMAELYDSALEACGPLRPPERVYLCLVDGGIISYYQLAMILGV
ncbi:hypothetical protein Poli38472_006603 [Pythium oligandrum]|uniref:Uncharacterized protein n=1 Tax=Pythium oligandrum TaxID=41045 RepID=A0A8K1FFA3_PYTOL|nr:hypothetical protein Poli38472_006603 [Pythium oligandrum]|eukprot:TMW56593.1 hypothetical protein Poli38472_006603 [Pythium oligandrum]